MSQREFTCPSCNSTFDRDVASALVILKEGLSLWKARETPGDENASAMVEYFKYSTRKRIDEPGSLASKGKVLASKGKVVHRFTFSLFLPGLS